MVMTMPLMEKDTLPVEESGLDVAVFMGFGVVIGVVVGGIGG